MIVLILVLIWLVVLAPAITHKLSSTDIFSSILRFHADTRLLRKILGHREDVIPVISGVRALPGLSHRELAFRNAEIARRRKQRQRTLSRRRRAAGTLLVGFFVTFVIGALPKLHVFFVFAGFMMVALIAYLTMLAWVTRRATNVANAEERRAKVVELPRTIFPVSLSESNRSAQSTKPERSAAFKVAFSVSGSP
ncbi:MAG TPA: hypothetical protein VMU99_05630 [Acidimicrobiales bacterium]|nr:hypothetical protein [Acidimicrobiales bacterium]